ncbi:MAG: uroporphyrinogen-III C-methyltransferase [Rhodoferax sp.]|jgi:uroporphyrin-III C-methyltransferase|nr:uroporphyrinogen-III C-methyltransferase [Rhodoferax sp.]MCP5289956.1 uroporphyrinogen-III C-methyltransferase [Burkholderiaceae bacterium]
MSPRRDPRDDAGADGRHEREAAHRAPPPGDRSPACSGRVVFVGAGPGSADLITLRGARWLARAEVVLVDALADPALLALAPQARWIDVGKRGYGRATAQATIDALLVHFARRHRVVVRLKGGDPSLFGRLEEELAAVAAHGIETEVVPGVTAACAAAAEARRPLTRRGRGRSVALVTAVGAEGMLPAGRRADTEVCYMAGRRLAQLGGRLRAAGWPAQSPVVVVSNAGSADARTSVHRLDALADAAELHGGRPTVVTVGAGAAPVAPQPVLQAAALSRPRMPALAPLARGEAPVAPA